MTRRIAAIGMVGAVALALTACSAPTAPSPEDSTEPVVVRVGIERIASIAPLYIADAKGYFADAGIDLEVQNVTSGQDAIPLAASGQLDVVVAGFSAGMFNAIANGLDVTVVGAVNVASGDLETSPSSLLVRKALVDSGEVTEVADLAGRTIGTVGGVGSSGGFLVGQVLEGGGLSLDDVTIENIPIPDVPAALESGGIDAGWTSAPFNTLALRDGVAVTLGVPTAGTTPVGSSSAGRSPSRRRPSPSSTHSHGGRRRSLTVRSTIPRTSGSSPKRSTRIPRCSPACRSTPSTSPTWRHSRRCSTRCSRSGSARARSTTSRLSTRRNTSTRPSPRRCDQRVHPSGCRAPCLRRGRRSASRPGGGRAVGRW